MIALLLYLEKFLLSFLVNGDAEDAARGLGELVRRAQHWTFHFLIAFSVSLAIFAVVRRNEQLAKLNRSARDTPLRPRWLLLHVALVLPLAPLTYSLFGDRGLDLPLPVVLVLWSLFALGFCFGPVPTPISATSTRRPRFAFRSHGSCRPCRRGE